MLCSAVKLLLIVAMYAYESEGSLKSFLGLLEAGNVTTIYKDLFIGDKITMKCVFKSNITNGNYTKGETAIHWVFSK